MFKRFTCMFFALLLCASSVFAWDSDSFVGSDSIAYYARSRSADAGISLMSDDGISLMSDTAYSSGDKLSFDEFCSLLSTDSKFYLAANVYHEAIHTSLYDIPAWSEQCMYPSSGFTPNLGHTSYYLSNYFYTSTLPDMLNGGEVTSFSGLYADASFISSNYWSFSDYILDVDLSPFGSFSSFEISGTTLLFVDLPGGIRPSTGGVITLYVNGEAVKSWESSYQFDFAHYIYNSSSSISSISLGFKWTSFELPYASSYTIFPYWHCASTSSPDFSFTVLSGDAVLDANIDAAQDALNQHDAIESQWTGSMSENFAALDLSNFSFDDGLVSAFALISGIFQDIWFSFGSYNILFVFPLFLGIVLLLVGRVSKFDKSDKSGPSSGSGPPAVV